MTGNLRDRISAVLYEHDCDGDCNCGCGWYPNNSETDLTEYTLHAADAVIEALEADYVLVPKGHTHARIHAAREAAKASDFQDDDDTACDTTWVAPGEVAKMMGGTDE